MGWILGHNQGRACRKINLAAPCLMESGVGALGELEQQGESSPLDF